MVFLLDAMQCDTEKASGSIAQAAKAAVPATAAAAATTTPDNAIYNVVRSNVCYDFFHTAHGISIMARANKILNSVSITSLPL